MSMAAHGISYIKEQQNPERTSESIISRTVENGMSVNLCEALTELGMVSNGTYSSLDIDFKWASQYPVSAGTPTAVAISSPQMRCYAEDVKYLKSIAPRLNEEYSGYVSKLEHPKGGSEGIATIDTTIDKKRSLLKITLSALGSDAPYFTKAVKAHESLCMLKCVGDLHKDGRQYTLKNPHDVEILADEGNHPQENVTDFTPWENDHEKPRHKRYYAVRADKCLFILQVLNTRIRVSLSS